MNRYRIEHNGQIFTVEASTPDEALSLVSSQGHDFVASQGAAAPSPEAPVNTGDWQEVARRVDAAATKMPEGLFGPVPPDQMRANRLAEAARQGELYGRAQDGGSTFGRTAANSIGLGLPNLLEAYTPEMLGGPSIPGAEAHEFIKGADRGRAAANPKSALAGTVTGIAGQIATLPATGGPTVASRLLSSAALGAGLGATEGAIDSRGDLDAIARGGAVGGAFGLGGGAVGEVVRPGIHKVAGLFNKPVPVPTREALADATQAAYQRAEQSGAMYSSDALKRAADLLEGSYVSRGFAPELQPGAAVALRKVQEAAASGQPITLQGVDTLRKIAGNSYVPGNRSNNALSGEVSRVLDDLVANPSNAIAGKADEAASALKEARELYSRSAKQDRIDALLDRAGIRADRAGSGGNIDNASRQEISKLLTDKNLMRGFTPDETAAIRDVVSGSQMQNALRLVGKLSPSGNGLMAALQAGAAGATSGATIPLALGGMGAKLLADRATARNIEKLGELVRGGGSRAAIAPPDNLVQRLANHPKGALIAAILGYQAAPAIE